MAVKQATGAFTNITATLFDSWPGDWDTFITKAGLQPPIVSWYQQWAGARASFDAVKAESVYADYNATLLLGWAPRDPAVSGTTNAQYTLDAIAAGNHDTYIAQFAADAADWGRGFFLKPMHEFNYSGIGPWAIGANGNTASDFAPAWQHIYDVVRDAGCWNARFVWNPLAYGTALTSAMYPGNEYVDVVALDGYNWNDGSNPTGSYSTIFGSAYDTIMGYCGGVKPFMIPEMGAAELGTFQAKDAWIQQTFDTDMQTRTPKLKYSVWFDSDLSGQGQKDWRVNSSANSQTAYADVVNDLNNAGKAVLGNFPARFVTVTKKPANTVAGSSEVISRPANLDPTKNQVLIFKVGNGGAVFSGQDPVAPAGSGIVQFAQHSDSWTNPPTNTSQNQFASTIITLFYKIVDGTEPASWTFNTRTAGATSSFFWAVELWEWVDQTNPVQTAYETSWQGTSSVWVTRYTGLPLLTTEEADMVVSYAITIGSTGTAPTPSTVITAEQEPTTTDPSTWPNDIIERYDDASNAITPASGTSNFRAIWSGDHVMPSPGTVGDWDLLANANTRFVGIAFGIRSAGAPTPEAPPLETERLVPNLEVAQVGLPNGALTDVDDDPTAPDASWKTAASDPTAPTADQTGLTNGPEYVDAIAGATGQTAAVWTNQANALDTSESTAATYAVPSGGGASYFSWAAADWSDIPSNAIITDIALRVRLAASNANRASVFFQLGTSNGNLIGNEGQADGGTAIPTTNQEYGANLSPALGVVPTRAQLVTGTFGVRIRMTRGGQTVTVSLYSVKMTVTYTIPGVAGETRATSYRVGLTAPSRALEPIGGGSKVRAYVRRRGAGTANPPARLEVLEAGNNTVLATALANTDITSSTGQYIEGGFDPGVLADISGANLEVRVASDGANGALVEVGAIDVLAGLSTVTVNYINGAGLSRANALMRSAVSTLVGGRGRLDSRTTYAGGAGNRMRSAGAATSHTPKSGQARALGNLLKGATGLSRSQSGADARANSMRLRDAAGLAMAASGADARAQVSRFRDAPAISNVGRAQAQAKGNAIIGARGASAARGVLTGIGNVMGIETAPALAMGRSNVYARPAIFLTSDGAVSRGASTAPGRAAAIVNAQSTKSVGQSRAYGPGLKLLNAPAVGRSASGAQATADVNKIAGAAGISTGRSSAQGRPNPLRGARATVVMPSQARSVGNLLKSAPATSTARALAYGPGRKLLNAPALSIGRAFSPVVAAKIASSTARAQGIAQGRALGVRVMSAPALCVARGLSQGRGAAIFGGPGLTGGRSVTAAVADKVGQQASPGLSMGSSNVYAKAAAIITTSGSATRARAVAFGNARGDKSAPALSRSASGMYAGGTGGVLLFAPALSAGRSSAQAIGRRLLSAPARTLGTSNTYGAAAPLKHAPARAYRTGAMAFGPSAPLKGGPGLSTARSTATGRSSKWANAVGTAQARSMVAGRPSTLMGGRARAVGLSLGRGRAAIIAAGLSTSRSQSTMYGYAELMGLSSAPALSRGMSMAIAQAAVTHAGRAVSTPRSAARAWAIRLVHTQGAISRGNALGTGRGGLIRMAVSGLSMSMSLTTATATISKVAGAPAISQGKSSAQAWALGLKGIATLAPIRSKSDAIAYPSRIRSAFALIAQPRSQAYGRAQGVKDAPGLSSQGNSQGRGRASALRNAPANAAGVSQVSGRAVYIAGNRGTIMPRSSSSARPSRIISNRGRSGGISLATAFPTIAKPGIDAPGLVRSLGADATARGSVVRGGKGLASSGTQALALAHPLRAAPALSRGTTHLRGRPGALRASGGVITLLSQSYGRATYIVASPGSATGFAIVVGPGDVIESVYPITIPGGRLGQRVGGDAIQTRITGRPGVLGGARIIRPGQSGRLGGERR